MIAYVITELQPIDCINHKYSKLIYNSAQGS